MSAPAPTQSLFRQLPQLGQLMDTPELAPLCQQFSRELVADTLRALLAHLRDEIARDVHTDLTLRAELATLLPTLTAQLEARTTPSLRRVLNATGTLLQTNLGRAPLSQAAIARIAETARGYANLEMDLATGERSRRDVHAGSLILDLIALRKALPAQTFRQSRAAIVVNNCAAATILALNTLAEGGEVLVSRGELVEIGGGFRVPDILRKSGAILREVGTTNRTRVADYASAITPNTRLILRVHQSNFRIEGFTERPTLDQLLDLSRTSSIPVFEDQGTGCVIPLPTGDNDANWLDSAASSAALVACSGDKLFGGPQCGILVGDRAVVQQLRANPLFRALRVDKLTYAALEATLLAYLTGNESTIPVLAMLQTPAEAIRTRCEALAQALSANFLHAEAVPTQSVIGGGTTPGATLPSFAVALRHPTLGATSLAAHLRTLNPPVVARISERAVLLDLRTIAPEDDSLLLAILTRAFSPQPEPPQR